MQTTANLWEVLCRDLETERRAATADQYYEIAARFVQSARQVLRAGSPKLCDAIEIAGDICQGAGRWHDAVLYFEEALAKAKDTELDAPAVRLAVKLGTAFEQTGDPAKGRACYEEALGRCEKLSDTSQQGLILSRLGGLCRREGDLDAAKKYYRQALDLAMRRHGETHTEVANAANNLGVVYTELNDPGKAEGYHMRALAIREKCFGAVHPDVALSMANLGATYHTMGDFARARAYYEGALKTYERFLPPDDPGLKTVKANYAALLEKVS